MEPRTEEQARRGSIVDRIHSRFDNLGQHFFSSDDERLARLLKLPTEDLQTICDRLQTAPSQPKNHVEYARHIVIAAICESEQRARDAHRTIS